MSLISKRGIAVFLSAAMIVGIANHGQAMLAPATLQAAAASRSEDTKTIQTFLEQKEVRAHLARMQLSPEEIEMRLGNLSDQELRDVSNRIHQQQPGRDAAGAVVTVLAIGVLVLLFIYLIKRV